MKKHFFVVCSCLSFLFSVGLSQVQYEQAITSESIHAVLSRADELQGAGGQQRAGADMESFTDREQRRNLPQHSMVDFEALENNVKKIEDQMQKLCEDLLALRKRIVWLKEVASLEQAKKPQPVVVPASSKEAAVEPAKRQISDQDSKMFSQTKTATVMPVMAKEIKA